MKVTIEMMQEMNKLYPHNSMRDLAAKFNLCSSTVRNYIWNPRRNGERCKREVKS